MPPSSQYPLLLPKPAMSPDPAVLRGELERITRNAIGLFNDREGGRFDSPTATELLGHIAPDSIGRLDNFPETLNFEQTMAICRSWAVTSPDVVFTVVSCEPHLDEAAGTASVLTEVVVSRFETEAPDLRVSGFVDVRWRREPDGRWRICEYIAMRAMQELDIPPVD